MRALLTRGGQIDARDARAMRALLMMRDARTRLMRGALSVKIR